MALSGSMGAFTRHTNTINNVSSSFKKPSKSITLAGVLGVGSLITSFGSLLYNVFSNERAYKQTEKWNRQNQSNWAQQFYNGLSVQSADAQRAGINPSAIVGNGGAQASSSFDSASPQSLDASSFVSLAQIASEYKLRSRELDIQNKLVDSEVDKNNAETNNLVNQFSHDEFMENLRNFNSLDREERQRTFQAVENYLQRTHESEESEKQYSRNLDYMFAQAQYDSQLATIKNNLEKVLRVNDARLKEVLMDKQIQYDFLALQYKENKEDARAIEKAKVDLEALQVKIANDNAETYRTILRGLFFLGGAAIGEGVFNAPVTRATAGFHP